MIDMVKKYVISPVMAYHKALADTITSKKQIGVTAQMETELLSKIATLAEEMYKRLGKLEVVVEKESEAGNGLELAKYSREQVFESMQSLRETVDELETLVASDYWQLPTYSEMLFSVM